MCISGLIDKAIVPYIPPLGSDSLRCYSCLRILEKILDDLKEALKNVPNQNSTIPHCLFHGCPIGVLAENYFSTSDGETFGDECLCHKELKTGFRILIA